MKENITMSTQEIGQVEIFEKLLRKEIKQHEAGKILGLSVRQVQRKIRCYKVHGAKSLVHQARGRVSNNKISQERLDLAIELIRQNYFGFAPTLACEKLLERHQLKLSVERLRQEMTRVGLWKAHVRKKAQTHQLRERRACFGELVQVDGSPHDWFEDRAPRCNLNAIIDDATGKICAALSKAETTKDYFVLFRQYFEEYGLPVAIYSDRHSIFKVNKPRNLDHKKPIRDKEELENMGLTQFSRAMKELGIELIFANTPQAKGRIERLNQTLQDRLVKEMRLRKISSISEANEYCKEFSLDFNSRFSIEPKSGVDMHRQLSQDINLDDILCIKEHRILSKNLSFQYESKIYQIRVDKKASSFRLRKSTVTVLDHCDGSITVKDQRGNLLEYSTIEKLPRAKSTSSKELNTELDQVLRKKRVQYPWEAVSAGRQLSLA